jgi:hypothetical protein
LFFKEFSQYFTTININKISVQNNFLNSRSFCHSKTRGHFKSFLRQRFNDALLKKIFGARQE